MRFLFSAILTLCSISLFSQNTTEIDSSDDIPRVYTTASIVGKRPVVIDGVIDETTWDHVPWTGDFIEFQPDENTPPSQQTRFKITYDKKFLYVAIQCYDTEPDRIEQRMSRRDGFQGDRIAVILDSYHDKRTAFAFSVTAAGVKGDEFVSQNGDNWDDSWNPIWYVATSVNEKGWDAEMKIPFSQLKFGKAEEQVWGLQLTRLLFREEQRSVWDRVPREAAGWVSEFGELRGLLNIQPQKQLEIQPFTVQQYDSYPKEANNPYQDGSDYAMNFGLDAKIGITNDLTLDLTVNPDFGQVEADPGAIALDGFQIFFREQRPFFVENKNIFDYEFAGGNDNLFYSRRIGRSPQGSANSQNGEFADVPTNTTILGAAKFSGKTKNGWSLGLLESVTGKMYAEIDANGNRRDELVEPLTNYLIGRVQKDFNDRNSFIGGMFTATNRQLTPDLEFLHKSAYTAGFDFMHNWKNRLYYVNGSMVASRVNGTTEAITETQESITRLFQRVDAGHVSVDENRTSLSGTGGRLETGKAGGAFRYNGGFTWRSPELELNDVGFLRSTDEIRQFSNFRYLFLKPTKLYRGAELSARQFTTYDFDGNHNRTQYNVSAEMNFQNNWGFDMGLGHKPRTFINSFLRGGPRWRFNEENFRFLFIGSDSRKKFSFQMGYVTSQAKQDGFSFDRYVFEFTYQPLNSLNIALETEFENSPNKTQYVTQSDFNGTPRYITAAIDQETWSTSLRVNYSINPNLSLQYYGQPFISKGIYSDFNYVSSAANENINERVTLFNDNQISATTSGYSVDDNVDGVIDYSFDNPDFSYVQFRSNLVVRWEYIPGSELFLVWSQGVTGSADTMDSLTRSLDRQIFGQEKNNTFLIKATYRFVL